MEVGQTKKLQTNKPVFLNQNCPVTITTQSYGSSHFKPHYDVFLEWILSNINMSGMPVHYVSEKYWSWKETLKIKQTF